MAGSVGTSSSVRAAPAPSAAPLAAGCCAGPTVSRLAGISHGRTTTLCAFWMTRNCHSCSRLTFRVISGAAASKATRASWRALTTLATLPEAFSWCRGFPRAVMSNCPCTSKKSTSRGWRLQAASCVCSACLHRRVRRSAPGWQPLRGLRKQRGHVKRRRDPAGAGAAQQVHAGLPP